MKRFTMVGALFALLAFTAMAMATAASAKEWLCNEKPVTVAKSCLITSENLEVFLFQDRGVGGQVECAVGGILSEGWAGPGAEDELTSVTFTNADCKASAKGVLLSGEEVGNACTGFKGVKALNLPWKTLIEEVGGKVYDTISPGSSGKQPGYEIECVFTDKCESTAGHELLVELNNLTEAGSPKLVDALFLAKPLEAAEFATCSLGGKEQGIMISETLLFAFIGGTLVPLEVS